MPSVLALTRCIYSISLSHIHTLSTKMSSFCVDHFVGRVLLFSVKMSFSLICVISPDVGEFYETAFHNSPYLILSLTDYEIVKQMS